MFTFEQIRLKTIRAAQNHQQRVYKPKQIFGIIAGNVAHLRAAVFASLCLGCPISTMTTSVEKQDLIKHDPNPQAHFTMIFCEVSMYDLVTECSTELGWNAKIFQCQSEICSQRPESKKILCE